MQDVPGDQVGAQEKAKAKEKAKERGEGEDKPPEGAQVNGNPPQDLGRQQVGTQLAPNSNSLQIQIKEALSQNALEAHKCQYMGLREKMSSWIQLGADKVLLQAIKTGVKAPLTRIPDHNTGNKQLSSKDLNSLQETIGEYLETGVIRPLTETEETKTKYWVPIFSREKKDSQKVRIITDLRGLNVCHGTPKFKSENWKELTRTLQEENLTWGITMDLKGYYTTFKCTVQHRDG